MAEFAIGMMGFAPDVYRRMTMAEYYSAQAGFMKRHCPEQASDGQDNVNTSGFSKEDLNQLIAEDQERQESKDGGSTT